MLNKVILMGRLTADPELRHTPDNIPVASFTLAVDRGFSKSNETDFIDIIAWRSHAEFVSKWFNKGKLVAVTGRLQIRNWKDKEGNNRRTAEVVVEECHFAESKRSEGASAGNPYQQPAQDYGYSSSANFSAPSPSANQQPRDNYDQKPLPSAPAYSGSGFSEILDDDEDLPF